MPNVISISGINKVVNQTNVALTANIDTHLIFTVDPIDTPSCSSILQNAYTDPNANTFLNRYKLSSQTTSNLITNLQNFKSDLDSENVDKNQVVSFDPNTETNDDIDYYLNLVNNSLLPNLRLVNNCLKENNSYNLEAIEKQKELTDESRLRLETVKDPETKVSYYEGWFPLFRPMSEPALFGIFTTAVFLLILSIGVFLRMSGIQFSITLPSVFVGGQGIDTNKFIMIGLGVGALGGLGVYGYNKGWFGKKDK